MDTPDKNSIGESRGNSISSGDPELRENNVRTSTDSTSNDNTGESAPQQGFDVVNEQEQHKTVNMEEYIENSAQNRLGDNEGTQVPADSVSSGSEGTEAGGNEDITNNDLPTMSGGAL